MSQKQTIRSSHKRQAFTLIELLVVISIIALLMAILMPALSSAKAQGKAVVCRSNIRQLVLANISYATENNGCYVLAASDIWGENLHRWHSARETTNDPFDPLQSDLIDYLGDGKVKQCPQPVRFRHGDPWDWDFEDGGGGYGYNMTYLGSHGWENFTAGNCNRPTQETKIGSPVSTVMFADTAMAKLDGGQPYYLEYSFVEPPFTVSNGQPVTSFYMSPSIHFRHRDRANVGWADGHVDARAMAAFGEINAYQVKSADMMIGWFEPMDNSLYDLK